MDIPTLLSARACLLNSRLVAYKKPLYQVLALGDVISPLPVRLSGKRSADVGMSPIDKILEMLAGGAL